MNTYSLSRAWFEWTAKHKGLHSPSHTAIYFYLINLNNKLKWKDTFGVPNELAMEATGIGSYKTYKNALKDLQEWGFITLIEASKNQHSANVYALVKYTEPNAEPKNASLGKNDRTKDRGMSYIDKQLKTSKNNMYSLPTFQVENFDQNTSQNTPVESPPSKPEKKPRNKKELTPPSIEEFRGYFTENGYRTETADLAFKAYNSNKWHDSHNNKIHNWKMKAQMVWFRPENLKGAAATSNPNLSNKPILNEGIDFD